MQKGDNGAAARSYPSDCVVLGAAVGYSEDQIKPFVRSLRATGYKGDVVLLVERTVARAARGSEVFADVDLITQRQWWPVRWRLFWGHRRWALRWVWRPYQALLWITLRLIGLSPLESSLRERLQLPIAMRLFPPTESRFIRFRRLLDSRSYSRVLLSDVRDVLFQSDPFKKLPSTGLAVSMEVAAHTITAELHTANWVRQGYGDSMLERIGSRQVSCSGATYGDRDSVINYLSLMTDHILRLGLTASGSSGIDQGIHNVLLATGRLGCVHYLEPMTSTIATLGGLTDADVRLDGKGRLLNDDASVPSVVHQYDRIPSLRLALLRSLVDEEISP